MSEAINETGLVKQIVKAVYEQYPDTWGFKVHGSAWQPAGIPDLLFCIQGKLFGFEVKHQKPGESREHAYGRATEHQLDQIAGIKAAGGTAAVVLTVEEVLDHIEKGLQGLHL